MFFVELITKKGSGHLWHFTQYGLTRRLVAASTQPTVFFKFDDTHLLAAVGYRDDLLFKAF